MKRGGYLQRRTPLERGPMRRRPPRRLDGPGADPARLEFVRHQPCVCASMEGAGPCWLAPGRYVNEANHAHELGLALKAGDARTFSMCTGHHRAWTDHAGLFRRWTRVERERFEAVQVAAADARWNIACAALGVSYVLPTPTSVDLDGEWRADMPALGLQAHGRTETMAIRRVRRAAGLVLAEAIAEAAA